MLYSRHYRKKEHIFTYIQGGTHIMKEKVVLAYSGGLDTTALIPWLKETFDYEECFRDRGGF